MARPLSALGNPSPKVVQFSQLFTEGNRLAKLQQWQGALDCFLECLAIDSLQAELHNNIGNVYRELGEPEKALQSYERAIALKPNYPKVFNNRGTSFRDLGLFDEALESYRQAISLEPDYATAHWNIGLLHLLFGRFKEGWAYYDWGLKNGQRSPSFQSKKPRWTPEVKLRGRLLVYAEQGLGDEIMFGALLRPLLTRGIAVTLMIDPRLEPLLARSLEGDLQFVHRGAKFEEDSYSHQCPMASLCEFFCTTEPSLKGLHPYLRPSEARVTEMRRAIAAHRTDRDLVCGISWRSGGARSGVRRSMQLGELLSKVRQPGMVFVNLQYGRCDEEILAAQAQLGVNVLSIPGLDTKADIDGLAALISACDAVVSVDNTTVHLAGALGKPTHVLLAHNADWRWMRARADSPWYPSVSLHRSIHRQRWDFEIPIAIQALSPRQSSLFEQSIKLHRQGELSKARPGYIEILKTNPNHFDSLQLLGLIEKKQGRAEAALNLYNRALALNPSKAAVFNNKGNALRELKRFSEARDCFNRAIKLSPQYAEGFYNRGLTENDLGEFAAAEQSFDEAIRLKSSYAEAWFDRGNALRHQYKFEQAIKSYNTALELKTHYFEAYNNLGKVYQDLRQMDKALEFYNEALSIKPDYEAANWNKALYFLRLGDYPQGWKLFEWGLRNGQRGPALKSTKPLWSPERPPADRVLCYSEQGLGDEIMFGALLPELEKRCSSLSVIMDARLIPLFQRWLGSAVQFIPRSEKLSEADYDSQIAAGSLCQYFRPSEASFRRGPAYLKACPKRKREIKELLKPLRAPGRKLCGISWRSKGARSGRERSLTLAELLKKAALTGYDFVSLQYDEQPGEVVAGRKETNETIFTCPSLDTFKDIEGVAALIQCCDLVVSVDNTTVHLAGALGIPTRVYLPYISDWRWMMEREDTPWYRALCLVRQGPTGKEAKVG